MFRIILKKEIWLPIAVLIVVGGFVYSFNLNNQLFWDDDDWIINNVYVHSISWENIKFWFSNNVLAGVGLQSNYYRPFLFFTFALNYIVSGVKPLAYHLTSNAIHIFNSILVFWLIRQIFKRNLLAFFASLFFLVHPLQTEAVTYISGRGDALVAMFMLLGLLFFYKLNLLTTSDVVTRHRKSTIGYWLLAIGSLILGLLSRETGIIFPVLALAFYVSVLSPSTSLGQAKESFLRSVRRGLVKTWPYFAVVIVYGILRLTVLNFLDTLNFYAEPNPYSENLHIRIFTFLPILWEYLKLLVVPAGLHMERSSVVYTSLLQWPVWAVFVVLAGLLAWMTYLYRKNYVYKLTISDGRGTSDVKTTDFRAWLFGVSWFFIALAPASGITPINALIYEHWLYLPLVGFWLIVSFYLVNFFDFLKSKKFTAYRLLFTAALVAYFSFFSYQSIRSNILWGKPIEFYKNILKYEPDSVRISNNLGNQYFNNKDLEQAEFYYRKAVDSESDFAQPYYNLGSILQTKGDIYGAIRLYEKAININPGFHYAYQNLAVIYARQGDLVKAIQNIETLKLLLPNNPRAYYNSALIYVALNNRGKALADLKEGLKYADLEPEIGKLIEGLIKELQ